MIRMRRPSRKIAAFRPGKKRKSNHQTTRNRAIPIKARIKGVEIEGRDGELSFGEESD
jgi:hypothetical protein